MMMLQSEIEIMVDTVQCATKNHQMYVCYSSLCLVLLLTRTLRFSNSAARFVKVCRHLAQCQATDYHVVQRQTNSKLNKMTNVPLSIHTAAEFLALLALHPIEV